MKKLISLCLAVALAISLVACGGQNQSQNEGPAVGNSANSTTEIQTQPSEQPEEEQEETSAGSGETSSPETPEAGQEEKDEEKGADQQGGEEQTPAVTASHSDVTFKSAGSMFKLTLTELPETMTSVAYVSKDEAVATVAEDGTVTAVAPGNTDVVMTVNFEDGTTAEFTCIIRCHWQEEPENGSENSGENTGEQETSSDNAVDTAVNANIDLAAFFAYYMEHLAAVLGEGNTPHTMAVEGELLDAYYAGLNDIATKQCVVQMPGIGAVPFEFALVEVENANDVEAVRAIFEARVTYQIEGGAWYPATIEGWEKADIIVNGNYVALIVAGDQQADAVQAYQEFFLQKTMPVE